MSNFTVTVCDLCGVSHRSIDGNKRHWSDCISTVVFDWSNHAGVQGKESLELCTRCATSIRDAIAEKKKQLSPQQ